MKSSIKSNKNVTGRYVSNDNLYWMNRRTFVKVTGATVGAAALGLGGLSSIAERASAAAPTLDPRTLTKYMDQLPIPRKLTGTNLTITMSEFSKQLHSQLPSTTVWGYNGTYPGPTIEATKGTQINVKYVNNLPTTHLFADAIDHTIAVSPDVRNVVHLHGAEVTSASDGNPVDWFTPGNSLTVNYPNSQQATTLWYHDHALGITRLNLYSGLAGFYLLRDSSVESTLNLPGGAYEIPLLIQDRCFFTNGSLNYLNDFPPNSNIHPKWIPEFFGDTILVNGKVWPYLNVEPRKYRFRILNGSNARFYSLSIPDNKVPFTQIGTDGGYLQAPVPINEIFIAPAERADVMMDFSGLNVGDQVILSNSAKAPFPHGTAANPQTVGQIMQFRVVPLSKADKSAISTPGNFQNIKGLTPGNVRHLTLNEVEGPGGPIEVLLNNTKFESPLGITENPKLGSTEIWEIINISADTHPIHVHLIQFQLISRQPFNAAQYTADYNVAFPGGTFFDPVTNTTKIYPAGVYIPEFGPPKGANTNTPGFPGGNPDVRNYLQGNPVPPAANEAGWKDTLKMNPGEVTRIIMRFARQDGTSFPFDATSGKGYVWHCHILEHEDNDMMRPYKVIP